MDFSLVALCLAIWAIVAAVFFWEESRADSLDEKRKARLRWVATHILSTAPGDVTGSDDLVTWLTDSFESIYLTYRHVIQPVRALMPYKKIVWAMIPATVFGIIYGSLKGVLSSVNASLLNVANTRICLSGLCATVVCTLGSLSLYWTIQELRWVLKLRSLVSEPDAALQESLHPDATGETSATVETVNDP